MKFQLLIVAAAALASLAYAADEADEDDSKSCRKWSKEFCKPDEGNAKYIIRGIAKVRRFVLMRCALPFENKIFKLILCV
jgi:hypothetical protein